MGRVFTITELSKAAIVTPGITDGAGFASSGTRFEWSAKEQSSPRNVWEFGLKLRTVRDDYPGSDEPVEQVLGPNFEPFDLEGLWDDRYMGAGRASATWKAFEALTQRGNLCRFEIEDVSITGLITAAKFSWFRAWRIGYHFTVSPHYRVAGGDVRRAPQLVPAATKTPQDYSDRVKAIAQRVLAAHSAAPTAIARGGILNPYGLTVGQIVDQSALIDSMIALRIPSTGSPLSPLPPISRVVQGFTAMRGLGVTLQEQARAAVLFGDGTNGVLPYIDPLAQLAYEEWITSLNYSGGLLAAESFNAARDLRRFAAAGVLNVYKPYAGESLYGISSRFYGTPHEWRRIADRNNITTLLLDGLTQLVIPDLGL